MSNYVRQLIYNLLLTFGTQELISDDFYSIDFQILLSCLSEKASVAWKYIFGYGCDFGMKYWLNEDLICEKVDRYHADRHTMDRIWEITVLRFHHLPVDDFFHSLDFGIFFDLLVQYVLLCPWVHLRRRNLINLWDYLFLRARLRIYLNGLSLE